MRYIIIRIKRHCFFEVSTFHHRILNQIYYAWVTCEMSTIHCHFLCFVHTFSSTQNTLHFSLFRGHARNSFLTTLYVCYLYDWLFGCHCHQFLGCQFLSFFDLEGINSHARRLQVKNHNDVLHAS